MPTGPPTLDEVERRVILARLRRLRGDKPAAARSLGVSLKTLYNKLNRYAELPAMREPR